MVRRLNIRKAWLLAAAAFCAMAIALPAAAQSSGLLRGIVKDQAGKPIEGAQISIESTTSNRRFDTKTDKRGEFTQLGVPSGMYKVTAEKDKVASPPVTARVAMTPGAPVLLVLGGSSELSPAATAKLTEMKKVFAEGVEASRAGKHDDAIAKFKQASELGPSCYDCYYNIGVSEAAKKDFDAAEVSFKKAIDLKADYADAYTGLANLYNATRKFDLAATASAKAAELSGGAAAAGGGGNADALFNQGVILWNAGKIPEAKKQFEAALAADPKHAESHYQLGMALVNEGNLAGAGTEFEAYLKLAPTGPNAATAQGILGSLKK